MSKVIGYRVVILLRHGGFIPICKETEVECQQMVHGILEGARSIAEGELTQDNQVKSPFAIMSKTGGNLSCFIDLREVVGAYYGELLDDPARIMAETIQKEVDKGEDWRGEGHR